jgi:SAM-dependent methyltransferase
MSKAEQTYDLAHLEGSAAKWRNSAALRAVYGDILRSMRDACVPGTTLEIGSGIGVAKEFCPDWVLSDVVPTPHVSRAVSAYEIPAEGWGNIVAFDVFHHLREPLRFLGSAADALRPGGRVVMAEPAGTPGGRIFYGLFHHEPCRPAEITPPYSFAADADGLFANMGMAHALFGRDRLRFELILQDLGLRIVSVRYRDLLAYPAAGGFSKPALLPAAVLRGILRIEAALPQALLRIVGLRMIVVLERRPPPAASARPNHPATGYDAVR